MSKKTRLIAGFADFQDMGLLRVHHHETLQEEEEFINAVDSKISIYHTDTPLISVRRHRHENLEQGRQFMNAKENQWYFRFWYVSDGVPSEDEMFADQRDDPSSVYLSCSYRYIVRSRVEGEDDS